MSTTASQPHSAALQSRLAFSRTRVVWVVFAAAMTLVCGVLLLFDGSLVERHSRGMTLGPTEVIGPTRHIGIFETAETLDEGRWQSIVIHHSSSPAGNANQIHRQHVAWGLEGLGYHFVIGNGNGLADGAVQIGYRWSEQQAGAHAIGPDEAWYNQHAIAICLVGNGDTRPFTDRQKETLINLVLRLQGRFHITDDQVKLHRDIAEILSPGRYFPEAEFRQRLASSSTR